MIVFGHCLIATEGSVADLSPTARHLELGVPIFFVISAFLLYRPFVAARSAGLPKVAMRDYAKRRALRIVPAYYAALVLLSIYPGVRGALGGDWWVYFGFLQVYHPLYSIDPACGAPPFPCGIAVAWSLAVEVTFYALLPLLVLALGRLTRGARRPVRLELGVLAALGLASAGVRLYAYEGGGTLWLAATLPATFLWFTAGMALAVVSVACQERDRQPRFVRIVRRRPWVPWLGVLALAAVEIIVFDLTSETGEASVVAAQVRYLIFPAIAVLLLLPATFGDRAGGWPRRILGNRRLAWIGVISYGIFLYHLPIAFKLASLDLFDISNGALRAAVLTIATFAASIACAALSYHLLERPLLRLKYGRRHSRSRSPQPIASDRRHRSTP